MRVLRIASLLLLAAPSVGICDGYFRCGSWLVSSDTSLSELLKKCGEPTSRKVSVEDVVGDHGQKLGKTRIETWRYDRGLRAAAMIVKVVDGKVESVGSESANDQSSEQ